MKTFLVAASLTLLVLCLVFLGREKDFRMPCACEWNPFVHHRHPSTERTPAATLKTITVAQVDLRVNDWDGDKIENFWRGDIAGLYTLIPPRGADPIRLIEISVAAADDRPLWDNSRFFRRAPKNGYVFRAIRHADEETLDPNRFAACAFPVDYPKSGRNTYVVDEGNTIFKRDLGRPGGIEVYPTDEELRTQWSKID